jgi:catechol 2,3-dioxygenase-like lactoylglutathione lyase family enzyme
MIHEVHHIQITIPPGTENAARSFYCTVLGLPEIEKPAALQGRGGLWVQVGSRQLHIGTEAGVDRTATKTHVAYLVTDLNEWRTRLLAHGIEPIESVPIPGYQRFECRDPFGNRLELIQAHGE